VFAVVLVTVAAFTDLVAYSIAVPVLPDLSGKLGASPTVIGLLFASFGLTLLLVSVPMGAVSDRIGRKGPLVAGLVALAASTVLFAFAERLSWLFAARLVQGAADAVTWVVGFALIADLYGAEERGRVMGFVMSGTSFGLMIGPSLGGWLYESGGPRLPFLMVAALAALTAAAFAWIRLPDARVKVEAVPVRVLVRVPAVASCIAAVAVASATLAMLEPVVSLWLRSEMALSPARIGLVFGVGAVVATGLHPIYGRLADRWGGRRLTILGLVAIAVMLPFLSRAWSFESAIALYSVQAAVVALVVTPSLAYMAEATSQAGVSSFGVAYGLYNVAWGAGLLGGPAAGGFLYERIGFERLALAWAPSVLVITAVLARASASGVVRTLPPHVRRSNDSL
jgi:DHA1 family solute carrier family 18 vesicular amine transporter 1/2